METADWPNVRQAAETWGSSNLSQPASEWGFLTLGTEKGADKLNTPSLLQKQSTSPRMAVSHKSPALGTVAGERMSLRSAWAT